LRPRAGPLPARANLCDLPFCAPPCCVIRGPVPGFAPATGPHLDGTDRTNMAFSKTRLVLMAVAVSLSLAACGGGGTPASKGEALDNFTAEEIYKRGEYALENERKPKDAVHYFSEVERLYPYSEWAKRALIMQAYSYHRARQYEEARGAAQRFLDNYPGDEDAAYAQYLLALSYYDQIDDIGRDQGLTFQ